MRCSIPLLALFAVVLTGCTEYVPPVFEEGRPLGVRAGTDSHGPRLTRGADGTVLLSWMERVGEERVLRVTEVERSGFGDIVEVTSDPQMFVNWADVPSVTVLNDGRWLAHWLSYSADLPYSYDVLLSQSLDDGATWSEPFSPHDDGTPTEHGFVTVFPSGDDAGLIWLDGRKTGLEPTDNPVDTGMTLRGAAVDAAGDISADQLIDDFICDCCQTDVAVTPSGPIAVYRDRTADEIRDISLSRYTDGAWQAPEPFSADSWEIAACPVNGPEIAVHGDYVAVAWFTAAGTVPRVKVRISRNGGRTFGDEIEIARVTSLGHVQIDWIGDNAFAVSWLQRFEELKDIQVRSVTVNGDLGRVRTMGRTEIERTFPQMLKVDRDLVFVWTDRGREGTRIRGVRARIVYAE